MTKRPVLGRFSLKSVWVCAVFPQVFDYSQVPISFAARFLLKKAESERLGTADATFDRYHLVNMARFQFAVMKAMYNALLLVQLESWDECFLLIGQNQLNRFILFTLGMVDRPSLLSCGNPDRRDCAGELARKLPADPLNQRGATCLNQLMTQYGDQVALITHCTFLFAQTALPPYNTGVFQLFATKEKKLVQQLAFAFTNAGGGMLGFWAIDTYSSWAYTLSPTFVGTCHVKQYPRFVRTMVVVATHVITDVYLGMLFLAVGGVMMVDQGSLAYQE